MIFTQKLLRIANRNINDGKNLINSWTIVFPNTGDGQTSKKIEKGGKLLDGNTYKIQKRCAI